MELPYELRDAIEAVLQKPEYHLNLPNMKKIAQTLSERYRKKSGCGNRLLVADEEAAVYSAVRMPATFGAVSSALQYTLECLPEVETPLSLLDVGAGTGTASWAADAILNLSSISCLEREGAMQHVGKSLMNAGSDVLQNARWKNIDIAVDTIQEHADLVIAAYVLNELTEKSRMEVFQKLWAVTDKILLIVEPGTPEGFSQISAARSALTAEGAFLAAPCPNLMKCPMPKDDWCHFTCRVQRSKLHKMLKEGDAPYEDEKFCYMAFSREKTIPTTARVLRHPFTEKEKITLSLCTNNGLQNVSIKKSQKTTYKLARKVSCGDSFTE